MSELLPCPFCGPGESVVEPWFDDVSRRWRVGCGRCGCSTGTSPRDNTEAPAIAAWNRRNHGVPACWVNPSLPEKVCDRAGRMDLFAIYATQCRPDLIPLFRAPVQASEARGDWVLVPREPTEAMIAASNLVSCRDEGREHWTAMISAHTQAGPVD